jgi:RecB family exonuclease
MKLQPLPQLQEITRLSPTMLSILKQCPLRAGLRQIKAQRTTKRSKAALLGTIAHRVLEKADAIDGHSENTREQASAIWDETVKLIAQDLQTSPLDCHLLPIHKWKGYYLLRERTIRQCEEIVSNRGSSETRFVSSERKFSSDRKGLTGKPDLVLRRADGLAIIDYKSGILPQETEAQKEKIESWRRQVLFYAVVVHAEFGEWPVVGEIRLMNKEVIPIPIEPEAATEVAEEAAALMADYNARIKAFASHSEMARYSPEGCAFCESKGSCDTFWRKNPQPIPGIDKYGCLSGEVLKVSWAKSGIGSLVIESQSATGVLQRWEITNLSPQQFQRGCELRKGDGVRLLDVSIAADAYRAKPTPASVVWKLPDGGQKIGRIDSEP